MPTYEYICRGCGHEFEQFQSITAPAIRTCPVCAKQKVERKIGIGAGILFKGGGFYETDYRSDGYTKAAEAERKASEPASGKDSSGSTNEPAASKQSPGEKAGSSRSSALDSKRAATPAATKEATPAPSSAPAAEGPSKAVHPSRVGRGIGNIVQRPPAPSSRTQSLKTPPKSSVKPTAKPAPKKPPRRSPGR